MARDFTKVSDHDLVDLIHKMEAELWLLEEEAMRRAVEGTHHEIVYQGVVVGQLMLFSDLLLDFMLRRIDQKVRHG